MQSHFNRFHGAHIVIADNNAREIKVYCKNDDDRDVPVVATVGRACVFIYFILLFSAFFVRPENQLSVQSATFNKLPRATAVAGRTKHEFLCSCGTYRSAL